MKVKDIVLIGMLGALLVVVQVGLAVIPNVELVSILVIIYTLRYDKKAIYMIYIFALLEGLLYGFGLWWIMYLYVWTILSLITRLFRNNTSNIFWAILSGLYGLSFGALCSIPYFFIGGIHTAFAYWVSGIPFDITHCIGNFVIALVLFKPLYYLFKKSDHILNIS